MRRLLASAVLFAAATSSAFAWSAHGHRTITYLALEGLPSEAPAWLRDASIRNLIAEESNEPDRWRGLGNVSPTLGHENGPDHYLDIEDLSQFGLTLRTVSPFRYEYLRDLAVAQYVHPENVLPVDPQKNVERTKPWPGFLPHSIIEHYNKLRMSFSTLRILEELKDPARADQLELARQNCIHEMGLLSHFVADAAQPLHTTMHHHGWVGENPRGFTRENGFHSYIDGTIVQLHKLTVESVRPVMKYDATVNASDPWPDVLTYIQRSFEQVEPLYQLEKDGELIKDKGKEFISARFADAGAMLSAMYWNAWTTTAPTEREITSWLKYNSLDAATLPYSGGKPVPEPRPQTPAPAPSAPPGPSDPAK